MNHICTWFCADEKGEESIFPQTGESSSGPKHQHIYWRCIVLFFITSRRFNESEKHVLYTNVRELPVMNGRSVALMLAELEVDVVFTDFKYKTPKGYFEMFQNQFYEFSILEHIVQNNPDPADNYMIVDSDCIFLQPADQIFEMSREQQFLSFEDDCTTELVIHGLNRRDMKELYEELLLDEVPGIPGYHLGEFFLASVKNINILFADFLKLWPVLLDRYERGLPKFNEEAQTLSFLYYKNGFRASPERAVMKRIWTNPVFYRNVDPTDVHVKLWHLPSEKTYGLGALYKIFVEKLPGYGFEISNEDFQAMVEEELGVPRLSAVKTLKYYYQSYSRALTKRFKVKFSFNKLQRQAS